MKPIKLIVAPIDFSEPSQEALETAADLAARYGAELLLVHVVAVILPLTSLLSDAEQQREAHAAAARHLSELASALAQQNIKVRTEVGSANEPGMEIVRLAADNHADMIVIATHGITGWRKLAFGSVADRVIKEAECPVLLMRVAPPVH